MASILLIEDGPGVGRQVTSLLAAAGHRVLRCGGGPTPLAACPLLRQGRIEDVVHIGVVAYHLLTFVDDIKRGRQEASFYADTNLKREPSREAATAAA